MPRWTFEVESRAAAPVQAVWDLLADPEKWPAWTWVRRGALERAGRDDRLGLGSVRRLGLEPFASSEEITAWEPPNHMGYRMLKGMPVRNYRAHVRLSELTREARTSTSIVWTGSFEPLVPGSGALMRLVLRSVVGSFAKGVARHAERTS